MLMTIHEARTSMQHLLEQIELLMQTLRDTYSIYTTARRTQNTNEKDAATRREFYSQRSQPLRQLSSD